MSEAEKPEKSEQPEKSPESDHWARLVSDLGVTPSEMPGPESPDRPLGADAPGEPSPADDDPSGETAARSVPQPLPQETKLPRPPREPRAPTDWDLLAEELGIVEPSTTLGEGRPCETDTPETTGAPEAGLVEPGESETSEDMAAGAEADEAKEAAARFEEAIDLFDEPAEPEPAVAEPTPLVEQPATATDTAPPIAEEPPPVVEQLPRESIFGAGIIEPAQGEAPAVEPASDESVGAPAAHSESDAAGIESAERAETDAGPSEAVSDGLTPTAPETRAESAAVEDVLAGPQAEPEDTQAAATAEAAPAKRGKRRRRRASRKKKGAAASDAAPAETQKEGKPSDAEGASATAEEAAQPPVAQASEQPADSAASSKAAAKGAKVSHRGIPTWEQAVGLIIAKNSEARPKTKRSNGPSRGRNGGRGSGRRKG